MYEFSVCNMNAPIKYKRSASLWHKEANLGLHLNLKNSRNIDKETSYFSPLRNTLRKTRQNKTFHILPFLHISPITDILQHPGS